MKLTDTFLRALKTTDKIQKYADGGGLYIHVAPTGGKLWRMAYRFEGKQKTLSFGAYPAVSLKEARNGREEAKEQIAKGIDPSVHRKVAKTTKKAESDNSLSVVAREWYERNKGSWMPHHGQRVLARIERDIIPVLGSKPIGTITAKEILDVLRRIEDRGAIDTAHRTLQTCGRIFRYAVATGRAERDTAADLRGALSPVSKTGHFASITEPKAVGALLLDIDGYPNLIIRAALHMLAYTFVRSKELRHAEWSEINFEGAEWRIPATRMKMKDTHIVPLAGRVLSALKDLQQYTGGGKYLFPGAWSNSAPISDMALLNALRRMGYEKGVMTVHGFRSMASTLLNEQGYNRDWIERQLAHGERNSIRAAYNYAEYLPERRRMMQEWADYLDGLREGGV